MIKPSKLKKGDKVAIVSLSSGIIGEENQIGRYYSGKKNLEELFGLEVVCMPNALKGEKWVEEHPELIDELPMDEPKAVQIQVISNLLKDEKSGCKRRIDCGRDSNLSTSG